MEKGAYEIQLILTRYKVASGLLTVLVESGKKKDGEVKEQLKKDFAADRLYAFDITYDGTVNLNYKVTESNQNTKIE